MDENQKKRIDLLIKLGLKYDGKSLIYEDINFHWTDIVCMTEEEFERAYTGTVKRMDQLKEGEER